MKIRNALWILMCVSFIYGIWQLKSSDVNHAIGDFVVSVIIGAMALILTLESRA